MLKFAFVFANFGSRWIDLLAGDAALEKRIKGRADLFGDASDLEKHLLGPLPESRDDREKLLERYPLLGVPFAVKDNIAVEGFLFTNGLVPKNLTATAATGALQQDLGCINEDFRGAAMTPLRFLG